MISPSQKDCCGCGVCAQVCAHGAITMVSDTEGFLYPEVSPDLCVDCGLCQTVCPFLQAGKGAAPKGGGRYFAALSRDRECTKTSSSGGVWFNLAEKFISDGGVAYGAAYDEGLKVRHIRAVDVEALRRTQGSKYVQSSLEGIIGQIKEDLKSGRKVLFSGTPCQVTAVRLATSDHPTLYTVDFTCHGVPSPMCFEDFLKFAASYTRRKVTGYTMRDKRDLSGFFKATLHLQDKDLYDKQIANLWHRMYFSDMITRPSCHSCPFASAERYSDISLGDFRGDAVKHKALFDEGRGVSQVILNTVRAGDLLEGTAITLESADGEDLHQPHLQGPSNPSPLRASLWKEYDGRDLDRIARKYWGFGKWNIVKRRMKHLFGK